MTEPAPPIALLALNDADGQAVRSTVEALDGVRVDAIYTLDRHKRTDPLDYEQGAPPAVYVTPALNRDPGAIPFLNAFLSANATHELRVVADNTADPLTPDRPGRDRTATYPWIYVRGSGWWPGPWTLSGRTATDGRGTTVIVAEIVAHSEVPLETPGELPGGPAVTTYPAP